MSKASVAIPSDSGFDAVVMRELPAIVGASGEMEPLQIGKWYIASYGYEHVEGQCCAITRHGAMLRFRWGGPFRTRQFVDTGRILGSCPDPRWITKLVRLFV